MASMWLTDWWDEKQAFSREETPLSRNRKLILLRSPYACSRQAARPPACLAEIKRKGPIDRFQVSEAKKLSPLCVLWGSDSSEGVSRCSFIRLKCPNQTQLRGDSTSISQYEKYSFAAAYLRGACIFRTTWRPCLLLGSLLIWISRRWIYTSVIKLNCFFKLFACKFQLFFLENW